MTRRELAGHLIRSRAALPGVAGMRPPRQKGEAEGGCGVVGVACEEPLPGRHLLRALEQMRNRGNGKGGGVAAVGLAPEELGVTSEVLERDYLLGVGYLDPGARAVVEREHIEPTFEVDHLARVPVAEGAAGGPHFEVTPPEVYRYFVRVRPDVVRSFQARHGLERTRALEAIEDEIVYQNTYRLNRTCYADGEKRAFVLSHGKDMLVLKMVGYGDDVVRHYRLEDLHAHVWIGHHRYPTKGKVWHPGGAHPFVGMHEALVHNGDFANYASICQYLAQRNIRPLFLTDTEVSVLVFDLLHRVYGYPLEYVIEALAPTTERDFALLPDQKRRIYGMLQSVHMHGSPDGPWFFLIAQHLPAERKHRLIGITDTSMLRPQVFALQQGKVGIGFAASEKQAIDAVLESLTAEDPRFWARADRYWNARGGSHTDGGAFIFEVRDGGVAAGGARNGKHLVCTDKFGRPVAAVGQGAPPAPAQNPRGGASVTGAPQPRGVPAAVARPAAPHRLACFSTRLGGPASPASAGNPHPADPSVLRPARSDPPLQGAPAQPRREQRVGPEGPAASVLLKDWDAVEAEELFRRTVRELPALGYDGVTALLREVVGLARGDGERRRAIEFFTLLMDRRYATAPLRRSRILSLVDGAFAALLESIRRAPSDGYVYVTADGPRPEPRGEAGEKCTVILDARGFAPEGPASLALEIVRLYEGGFRRFLVAHARGHRFIANGLGSASHGVRLDVYGSPGDYLASGLDGAEVYVHNSGQDQLAQIMKDGLLVVYGDVGQTFMYGAKAGSAFVLGNAAGRPLINAVGGPRVVVNGTCLDYLAESFMAGDPLNGGGFVVLNGIAFDDDGSIVDLESPYPGGNLFSLASGGAIYVRDPRGTLTDDQLNGGQFAEVTPGDWAAIWPYLEENERLFGIPVARLLQVDGELRPPGEVYRKIRPGRVRALEPEEAWVRMRA